MRRIFGRVWRKCFSDSKGEVGKLGLAQMCFCSPSHAPWDWAMSDQREGCAGYRTRSRCPWRRRLLGENKQTKKKQHMFSHGRTFVPLKIPGRVELGHRLLCSYHGKSSNAEEGSLWRPGWQGYTKEDLYLEDPMRCIIWLLGRSVPWEANMW